MNDITLKHNILSTRMKYIDTSQIRKLFDLSQSLKNPINLSIGQPHFPTPQPIIEAMEKALRDQKTSYTITQGIRELREKLYEKFTNKNHIECNPDTILVSSGVSSLLMLLFMSTIDEGDEVLLIEPAFLIYRSLTSFFRAKEILLNQNFKKEDIENLKFNKLKLIIFSSPSNPTGYILSKEQIKILGNLAEKTGALLVSDEIYELFDYENTFISAGSIYPKTLTLMGFSKSYSMTGLRLSAATGPSNIIHAMKTLQQYTVVCAPSAVQYAGIVALDVDISEYVQYYNENRNLIINNLKDITEFYYPSGAIYLFAKVPEGYEDQSFCEHCIKEKELLVVPGNPFTNNRQWIRISFAVNRETLQKGILALKDLYKN